MSEPIVFSDGALYAHHTLDENPDPNRFYLHTHEYYEIYYFLRGDAEYIVEGNRYELSPGDLLIMRPSEAHRLHLKSAEPYERISIHFGEEIPLQTGVDLAELLAPFNARALGRGNHFGRGDFADSAYEWYIRKALLADASEEMTRMCLEANLFGILIELYRAWKGRAEPPAKESTDPLAAEMIDFINHNLTSELSIPMIASKVFLGTTRAKQIFREATGISIWNYVVIKRMHYARAAIRNGRDLQIVGAECGYRDYASFYRAYRKYFDCRPNEDKPSKKR